MAKDKTQMRWHSELNALFNRAMTKQCMLGASCAPAARNHGISATRVLRRIAEDGKVIAIVPSEQVAQVDFGLKGVGQVSTFSAFCAKHDQELFGPIDNVDYQPGNLEQQFLFAYRTIAQQYHVALAERRTQEATIAALDDVQRKGQKLGSIVDGEQRAWSDEEMSRYIQSRHQRATDAIAASDGLEKLMRHLSYAYLDRDYGAVSTTILEFPDEYPVAQSSAMTWGGGPQQEIPHTSTVNVFSQQGRTYGLLSCASGHGTDCIDSHLELFRVDGQVDYRAALTHVMCWSGETIVFKPSYWRALPDDIRRSFSDRLNVWVGGGTDFVQPDGSFNILQDSIL